MSNELALVLTTPQFIIFVATFFTSVILLGILLHRYIIKDALKHIINPEFEALGYKIEKVETVGFFSSVKSEFDAEGLLAFWGESTGIRYTYIYLFVKNVNGKLIKVPARIKTLFFSIKKVEYSKQFSILNK